MGVKNEEEHIFWDGGFRSNTPLREVIQAHRDYWHKTRKHTEEEEQDKHKNVIDVSSGKGCNSYRYYTRNIYHRLSMQ
jgi:hypothetical protein